jgi:hypothetical protein
MLHIMKGREKKGGKEVVSLSQYRGGEEHADYHISSYTILDECK